MANKVEGWSTYKLYNGAVQLGFDEKGKLTGHRHSYWLRVPKSDLYPHGRKLIYGVTGVISVLNAAAAGLSPWAARQAVESLKKAGHVITDDQAFDAVHAHENFRDQAATRGSNIHAMLERVIKWPDQITPKEKDSKTYRIAAACVEFLDKQGFKVVSCEEKVCSKEHEVAGTTDLDVEKGGQRFIIDAKTSKAFRLAHAIQGATYAKFREEEFANEGLKYADAAALLASEKPKLHWLSEYAGFPGPEALDRYYNAFLGLLAVRTSIPNVMNWGKR